MNDFLEFIAWGLLATHFSAILWIDSVMKKVLGK